MATLIHAYATEEQLSVHMGDPNGVADQEMLIRALNASSRQIDQFCGRRFWLDESATARTYRCDDDELVWVDDIGSTDGLVIKTDEDGDGVYETIWDASDYELEPENADSDGGAYAWWRIRAVGLKRFPTSGRRKSLHVTARHGWSAIPPDVEEACLLRAAGLFHRRNSPQGVAGFDGVGAVIRSRVDPDFAALLRPYMRIRMGAV